MKKIFLLLVIATFSLTTFASTISIWQSSYGVYKVWSQKSADDWTPFEETVYQQESATYDVNVIFTFQKRYLVVHPDSDNGYIKTHFGINSTEYYYIEDQISKNDPYYSSWTTIEESDSINVVVNGSFTFYVTSIIESNITGQTLAIVDLNL